MKAALIDPIGIDNLKIVDMEQPDPGPGEVLVAIKYASLNYRDFLAANGGYGRMQKQEKPQGMQRSGAKRAAAPAGGPGIVISRPGCPEEIRGVTLGVYFWVFAGVI